MAIFLNGERTDSVAKSYRDSIDAISQSLSHTIEFNLACLSVDQMTLFLEKQNRVNWRLTALSDYIFNLVGITKKKDRQFAYEFKSLSMSVTISIDVLSINDKIKFLSAIEEVFNG